jgi:hypothetical protein
MSVRERRRTSHVAVACAKGEASNPARDTRRTHAHARLSLFIFAGAMMAYRSSTLSAPPRWSAPPLARRKATTARGCVDSRHLSKSPGMQSRSSTSRTRRRRTDPATSIAEASADVDDGDAHVSSDGAMQRVRRSLTAAAAAATVALSVGGPIALDLVFPQPAEAITSNNLLFLEAWRAAGGCTTCMQLAHELESTRIWQQYDQYSLRLDGELSLQSAPHSSTLEPIK